MAEILYRRLRRLRCERWAFAHAMYGWSHPHNIKWAETRQEQRRFDEIAELRRRVAELVAAKRQHVADEPEQPEWHEDNRHNEQGSEPVVIRRRGGHFHAK